MRTLLTIEARMGSTRLPGKVLLDGVGKPLLAHMIERVSRARRIDGVVVATTDLPRDNVIEQVATTMGCLVTRGSENNITARLIQAAHEHGADVLVQTTGDCPLHDPEVIDDVVSVYAESTVDYVSNRLRRSWPTGLDTQVYHRSVLERVVSLTDDPTDLEHGSYFIYTHPELFTMKNVASLTINVPAKRWCLDYPEDYAFIKAIFERLYPTNPNFSTGDILRLLEAEPHLEAMNAMHPCSIEEYRWYETLPR